MCGNKIHRLCPSPGSGQDHEEIEYRAGNDHKQHCEEHILLNVTVLHLTQLAAAGTYAYAQLIAGLVDHGQVDPAAYGHTKRPGALSDTLDDPVDDFLVNPLISEDFRQPSCRNHKHTVIELVNPITVLQHVPVPGAGNALYRV